MFENLWRGIKQNIAALLTAVQIERNSEYDHTAGTKASAMFKPSTPMRLIWKNCSVNRKPDLVTEAFDPDGTDFSPEALAQKRPDLFTATILALAAAA